MKVSPFPSSITPSCPTNSNGLATISLSLKNVAKRIVHVAVDALAASSVTTLVEPIMSYA